MYSHSSVFTLKLCVIALISLLAANKVRLPLMFGKLECASKPVPFVRLSFSPFYVYKYFVVDVSHFFPFSIAHCTFYLAAIAFSCECFLF